MIVDLEQRSPEWFAWRKGGITASNAGALLGKNPYCSRAKLWRLLTGREDPPEMSEAMQHGVDTEDEARAHYAAKTGQGCNPECHQHDVYPILRASLDGMTLDGEVIEIKCPQIRRYRKLEDGANPPEYWEIQIQYQMLCAGADFATLSVYSAWDKESIEYNYKRDDDMCAQLIDAAMDMWRCKEEDIKPKRTA